MSGIGRDPAARQAPRHMFMVSSFQGGPGQARTDPTAGPALIPAVARATWVEDGALRSGEAAWRLVGGPLPPRATLKRLETRLHELHDLLRR